MSTGIKVIETVAYADCKPGTSGLRKKVKLFQDRAHYAENYIQSILDAAKPKTLVVGGDGRYYSHEIIAKIVNICCANQIERLVVAKDGILSTPAAANLVCSLKAEGAIILTASHNPGGPDGDFGIKYNIETGAPATETLAAKIHQICSSIKEYKIMAQQPEVDVSKVASHTIGATKIDIVDPVEDYVILMKSIFDFDAIKKVVASNKIVVDSMNGVMGPYAKRIIIQELGAPPESVINEDPKPDFAGKHPDPNLTYARDLVEQLKSDNEIKLGVAFDGDGDRNMILGAGAFFVSPGDSLAVIGHFMSKIRPSLDIKGFARSIPTAPAIDRVSTELGLKVYETPTGWKYFGNLLDAGMISLCGEESFGTGSSHVREKDGMFACLSWLAIMALEGKSVRELVESHWAHYGRDYFRRLDYENYDAEKCSQMMAKLEADFVAGSLNGRDFADGYQVATTGKYSYTDPVDGSETKDAGLYVKFTNQARIVYRLSGTGSSGATVRIYLNSFAKQALDNDVLKPLVKIALDISELPKYIGTDQPTVIT